MVISVAVPRDGTVYVFDSDGRILTTIPLGSDEKDGLVSFTPSTVTVKRDGRLLVYGEDGALVSRLKGT